MTYPVLDNISSFNFRFIHDRIGHDCDIFDLKPSFLKKNIRFSEIREDDRWRVQIIKEIVNINQNVLDLKNGDDAFLTSDCEH